MQSGKKISNYIKPMLAKETAEAFDDKGWLFEIKWDGYRAIAEKKMPDLNAKNIEGAMKIVEGSARSAGMTAPPRPGAACCARSRGITSR